MTVSERLFDAGLVEAFDTATTSRDRSEMIRILTDAGVENAASSADAILQNLSDGFVCPVCGYSDLPSPPYVNGQGYWAHEICPSCGTQFGYDDCDTSHEELRQRWLALGAAWWSPSRPQPTNFDGIEQLRRAGLLG
jgi:hypothetical protein